MELRLLQIFEDEGWAKPQTIWLKHGQKHGESLLLPEEKYSLKDLREVLNEADLSQRHILEYISENDNPSKSGCSQHLQSFGSPFLYTELDDVREILAHRNGYEDFEAWVDAIKNPVEE